MYTEGVRLEAVRLEQLASGASFFVLSHCRCLTPNAWYEACDDVNLAKGEDLGIRVSKKT